MVVPTPRPPPGPASPARRRVTSKSVRVPEPDAEPPVDPQEMIAAAAAAGAAEELLPGFGVVGGSDLPDTEEVSVCMPLPTGDEASRVLPGDCPPRATYVGGIGRSAGTKMSKSKVHAGYKKSESMRPDEATGKPGAKLEGSIAGSIAGSIMSTGITVDAATAAADQERLVSAAVAGEVDDVQQLLGRAGVRLDGIVEEGLAGLEEKKRMLVQHVKNTQGKYIVHSDCNLFGRLSAFFSSLHRVPHDLYWQGITERLLTVCIQRRSNDPS